MSKVITRNASIDLLRLVFMYAICLQHVTCVGGYVCPWLNKMISFGVNGFILISAWYGVLFRVSKVIRLLTIGGTCALIVASIQCLQGDSWVPFEKNFIALINGWWFLHAYVVLIMLSPLLNIAATTSVRESKSLMLLVPLILVAFGWSYATTLPLCVSRYVPNAIGLAPRTPLTVCAVYLVGRIIRLYYDTGVRWNVKKINCYLLLIVFFVLMIVGLDDLNSPVNLCVSGLVFYTFYNMKLPQKLGWLVSICSGSVFSVYLFHVSGFAFSLYMPLKFFMIERLELNVYVVYIVMSLGLMVGGILLDVPRRVVGLMMDEVIRSLLKRIDNTVERILVSLGTQITSV